MIIYKNSNVTVFQSRLFQLNSTVVSTDDLVLVVDPGYLPDEVEEIRLFVEKTNGNKPVFLFFTHSDFDHIAGYGAFPQAKTIAAKEFVVNPLKESQLKDLMDYDEEFYILRPYPVTYPAIDHVISMDGEKMKIGKTTMKFYHAFGHTGDGLMVEIENYVVAGDYLSDIEFPFVYSSFSEYEKTLKRCKKLFQLKTDSVMVTCHGSVADTAEEIRKRISDSEDYLAFVKSHQGEAEFKLLLDEKNYQFKKVFLKRHEDNRKVWMEEKSKREF